MRRRTLILALAISAASAMALLAIVCGCYRPWHSAAPQYETDLAAPLPAEAEAELAASLPAIDEIKLRRGSLLDGTLLESAAEPEAPHDSSNVDLLRREARRLDGLAADREDFGDYDLADALRSDAQQLREKARELAKPIVTFYSELERR
jgi:hypothetical protein